MKEDTTIQTGLFLKNMENEKEIVKIKKHDGRK